MEIRVGPLRGGEPPAVLVVRSRARRAVDRVLARRRVRALVRGATMRAMRGYRVVVTLHDAASPIAFLELRAALGEALGNVRRR